jgi:transcriptional regulator with XRE-family HTH domain
VNAPAYGNLLRESRSSRGLSQLRLAEEAGVSTRHLSFLETGRALPSREMVSQLCEALEIPPRQRNVMLLAAGYAPMYREHTFDSPELASIRRVVGTLIESHAPFPALVLDRAYDIVMVNSAAAKLGMLTADGGVPETNLLRWLLSPNGLRPFMTNWHDVASHIVRRLRRETRSRVEQVALERVIGEALAGVVLDTTAHAATAPLVAIQWRFGDVSLETISTITTFGTSADIALDELRIETVLPVDDASHAALVALLGG